MKKFKLALLLLLVMGYSASAQKYRTAVGARLGRDDFGLSIQQKILERNTLEGMFLLGSQEGSGTVLFEHHFPLLGKGFNYYLGAGAHVGQLKETGVFYGGDVILGTELKLPILPLLLSFDVKPAVHINHEDWFSVASGFTLRYILVKEKKEKKKFGIFGGNNEEDKSRSRRKKDREEPKKKGVFNFQLPGTE